jgi:hypothetical protein
MEKLFLRALLPRQELNVVDHQHVDMPVSLPQVHHLVVADGVDDLIRELLGRQIGNAQIGALGDMVGDRVQQVGLPESDSAINKEGVVGFCWLFCDCHTGGVRELIAGTHDEILK